MYGVPAKSIVFAGPTRGDALMVGAACDHEEAVIYTWRILLSRGKHRIFAVGMPAAALAVADSLTRSGLPNTQGAGTDRRSMGPLGRFYRGKTVFMTGGTGFHGIVTAYKLVMKLDVTRVHLLVRGDASRLASTWNSAMPSQARLMLESGKIVPISGDITKPRLGLSEQILSWIALENHVVIHIAANIALNMPLERLVRDNCTSALHLVELVVCTFAQKPRIFQNSTAFVSVSQTDGKMCREQI